MFTWFSKKKEQQQQIKSEPQSEVKMKSLQEIELEEHLGKLVICVSNEVENPTVGYGKEIIYLTKANQPFLVVQDIVHDKEILPLGTIFVYTEQKFNALNKLDPNERIAIIYNKMGEHIVENVKADDIILFSSEEWKQKVFESIEKWKAINH